MDERRARCAIYKSVDGVTDSLSKFTVEKQPARGGESYLL